VQPLALGPFILVLINGKYKESFWSLQLNLSRLRLLEWANPVPCCMHMLQLQVGSSRLTCHPCCSCGCCCSGCCCRCCCCCIAFVPVGSVVAWSSGQRRAARVPDFGFGLEKSTATKVALHSFNVRKRDVSTLIWCSKYL